jgi:hypothetical protein
MAQHVARRPAGLHARRRPVRTVTELGAKLEPLHAGTSTQLPGW